MLTVLAISCTTWVAPLASVEDVVRSRELPRVRIRARGEAIVLHFPRILGDSLVGSTTTPTGRHVLEERVAYGLDEVEDVEVETFETERTTLAIGTMLGAWLTILLLAVESKT
jgi:hypothetical protein